MGEKFGYGQKSWIFIKILCSENCTWKIHFKKEKKSFIGNYS